MTEVRHCKESTLLLEIDRVSDKALTKDDA